MPTAFTVAGAVRTKVPPLERYLAVPDPGTGVEPSVVYQMPVLPSGCAPEVYPASVSVTVRGKVCPPLAGDIVGATLVMAEVDAPMTLPLCEGGFD
jgi:hypothetical protein